jgi:hypothetical protein
MGNKEVILLEIKKLTKLGISIRFSQLFTFYFKNGLIFGKTFIAV